MIQKDFNKIVENSTKRIEELLLKKGEEYANKENVFHNFDNGKNISLHKSNVAYAWSLAVKHLQSIKDIIFSVENGKLSKITPEKLGEKFGDAVAYFILIEGMILETIEDFKKNKNIEEGEAKNEL